MRSGALVNLAPGGVPIALTTAEENARLEARQRECRLWIGGNRLASTRRGFYVTLMAQRRYQQVVRDGWRTSTTEDDTATCLHRQAHTPAWARP